MLEIHHSQKHWSYHPFTTHCMAAFPLVCICVMNVYAGGRIFLVVRMHLNARVSMCVLIVLKESSVCTLMPCCPTGITYITTSTAKIQTHSFSIPHSPNVTPSPNSPSGYHNNVLHWFNKKGIEGILAGTKKKILCTVTTLDTCPSIFY